MNTIPRSLPILAVDDTPSNLLAVEAALAELGEVVTAASGREALRLLLDRDFAVIIMDALMPELDGFTTASLIRERPRSRLTPIIFLTALRAEDDLFQAYELGAVDYLFKPVVPQVLRAKVKFFLELAQSQQQLRRALAELEQFAAIASHDLKEPLRTISSYTELLARSLDGQLDERARQYLDFAGQGARRMHHLIDDLLAFARLGAPDERNLQRIETQPLAAAVFDGLHAAIEQAQAVVHCGPLPAVRADPTQFRQLLQNLVANALKFSPAPAQVSVSGECHGGYCCFSVRDSGIGFDMRFAERIFQPFQRLHARGEYSGTGIGLALCKKIVELHGGVIWAESAPGQGATFFFTFPSSDGAQAGLRDKGAA
ncbi:MAG: sensor histidine kinase [Terriglobales bacterium]